MIKMLLKEYFNIMDMVALALATLYFSTYEIEYNFIIAILVSIGIATLSSMIQGFLKIIIKIKE